MEQVVNGLRFTPMEMRVREAGDVEEFTAYHAVTDRPMRAGQTILFDDAHHSGVYTRVMEKLSAVEDIYAHPGRYTAAGLEHHTAVALRELALEEVRRSHYAQYPSRLNCLYVTATAEEAEKWAGLFAQWGRPTYHIVKLRVCGRRFVGDANNCFDATPDRARNLALADRYWKNEPNPSGEPPIWEILADGKIEVVDILKEIRRNIG